jgi:hypothetical protein
MESENIVIPGCMGDRATTKALCVLFDHDSSEHWIPFSQIQPDSEIKRVGDRGSLVVPSWFASSAKLFAAANPSQPPTPKGHGNARALENESGRGVLFRRRAQGSQPNYEGGFNLDGSEYRLVAWIKESKSGVEYLSLAIEPAPVREAPLAGQSSPRDDGDIPF